MADFTAELLGLHDAKTPAGAFPDCMVVRYAATLTGSSKGGAKRSGRIVITEWYAPGVGKVMAKEEVSETTTSAKGWQTGFEEEVRYALSLTEFEAAPPASPAPGGSSATQRRMSDLDL